MTWLISKLSGWASAVGIALAVLAGVFFMGRREGYQAQKQKQAKDNLKAVKTAKGVEDDIRKSSADDIDDRLSRWMRDKR